MSSNRKKGECLFPKKLTIIKICLSVLSYFFKESLDGMPPSKYVFSSTYLENHGIVTEVLQKVKEVLRQIQKVLCILI